jgi:hypothetical protein
MASHPLAVARTDFAAPTWLDAAVAKILAPMSGGVDRAGTSALRVRSIGRVTAYTTQEATSRTARESALRVHDTQQRIVLGPSTFRPRSAISGLSDSRHSFCIQPATADRGVLLLRRRLGLYCMLLGESEPPRFSGTTWSMT